MDKEDKIERAKAILNTNSIKGDLKKKWIEGVIRDEINPNPHVVKDYFGKEVFVCVSGREAIVHKRDKDLKYLIEESEFIKRLIKNNVEK